MSEPVRKETTMPLSAFDMVQEMLANERKLALLRAADIALSLEFATEEPGWTAACRHIAKQLQETLP